MAKRTRLLPLLSAASLLALGAGGLAAAGLSLPGLPSPSEAAGAPLLAGMGGAAALVPLAALLLGGRGQPRGGPFAPRDGRAEDGLGQERRVLEGRIAEVSHDLRSPIASASGYLRFVLAGESGELNEEQRELLATALSTLSSLDQLIDDELEYARLRAGAERVRLSARPVPALARETVAGLGGLAWERGVELSVEAAQDLPAARMDPLQIRRVLENLLGNALKFTAPGGSVTVSARRRGPEIELSVADTGCGMRPEEISGIFDRFRQAGGGRCAASRGSGLGLAIAAEIVSAHGGRIWAASEPGKGATFRFTLPACTEAA